MLLFTYLFIVVAVCVSPQCCQQTSNRSMYCSWKTTGNAVNIGLGKWDARAAARTEFCIPSSIDIVLARGSCALAASAKIYSYMKPPLCRVMIAPRRRPIGSVVIVLAFDTEIIPYIKATRSTEGKGGYCDIVFEVLGTFAFANKLSETGKRTTCIVEITSLIQIILTLPPASFAV